MINSISQKEDTDTLTMNLRNNFQTIGPPFLHKISKTTINKANHNNTSKINNIHKYNLKHIQFKCEITYFAREKKRKYEPSILGYRK